jgi:hypothetical protein
VTQWTALIGTGRPDRVYATVMLDHEQKLEQIGGMLSSKAETVHCLGLDMKLPLQ